MGTLRQQSPNTFVAGSLWMLGGGIGRAIIAVGVNLVLVRYLSPEEFGHFALIQATIGVVAGTVHLKVNEGILRAHSHELATGRQDILFSALVVETTVLGVVACCLLWAVGLWGLWAGILVCGTIALRWVLTQFAHYERRCHYKNLFLTEGGASLLSQILVVTGVVLGLGPLVLYTRPLLDAIGRFAGLLYIGGTARFHLRWLSLRNWKAVYHDLRGLWLDGWLEYLLEQLPTLIVAWIAGEKTVGYFFQARYLANTPYSILVQATKRVPYNYFSRHIASADGDMHGLKRDLGRTLVAQIVLLGVAGIAVILFADPLVLFLFGEQWMPVAPLLQAMTGIILATTPFNTLRAFFMAKRRMRFFVLLGVGIQYAMLAMAMLAILAYHVPAASALAFGLSVGYVLGFLALLASYRYIP